MNLFLSANSAFCELIETLWNVNEKMIAFLTKMMNELIETLWNVNRGDVSSTLFALGN